jgi:glycosyltransferase involved in cell wall biosynthesis
MNIRQRMRSETHTKNERPIRVLYFAVEDFTYPRNVRIRNYLESRNAEIDVVVRAFGGSKKREYFSLLQAGIRHRRSYDLVVLSEFSSNAFPISWLTARLNGAVHVVDFFVGKYETLVEDRGSVSARSWKARLIRILDSAAIRSADIAFSDTAVRADAFQQLGGGRTSVLNLPVGAPSWTGDASPPMSRDANSPLRVVYYGHYIPLHGVDTLVDALIIANKSHEVQATMIGDGTSKADLEAKVARAGLEGRIEFKGYQAPDDLMRYVSECDVVLGIFGTSTKAGSVIANKVWQGLYAERIVVTRNSEALAEIKDLVGSRLVQVDAGDPDAIAEALVRIASGAGRPDDPPYKISVVLETYVAERFAHAFSHKAFKSLLR